MRLKAEKRISIKNNNARETHKIELISFPITTVAFGFALMTYILKNYSDGKTAYAKPENIVEKTCFFGRTEYFVTGTESKASCGSAIFSVTPTPTKTN